MWLTPTGAEMTGSDWSGGFARSLAVCLNGDAITEPGPRGERITDADFVLLLNAHSETVPFCIPAGVGSGSWQVVVNTGAPTSISVDQAGSSVEVGSHTMIVLRAAAPQ